jgi:hypothetical protein
MANISEGTIISFNVDSYGERGVLAQGIALRELDIEEELAEYQLRQDPTQAGFLAWGEEKGLWTRRATAEVYLGISEDMEEGGLRWSDHDPMEGWDPYDDE